MFLNNKKIKLSKIDIETGTPQWTYTCPEGQKITGEMYEYGGVLAFTEIDAQLKTTAVGFVVSELIKSFKMDACMT